MKREDVLREYYTGEEISDEKDMLEEEFVIKSNVVTYIDELESKANRAYYLLDKITGVRDLDNVQDCLNELGELKDILY